MSESVRQRRFGSSHRADSSPSVRTQAAAPEYPALHVRRPREPAHTGHPRGLHPHSHAHPFTEAALCTYPPPRERHSSSAGSHGARIQPPPYCSAKSKAADLSTQPQQHQTTSESGRGRGEASLHSPGFDHELGRWGGVAKAGFTHSTPNRTPPGAAPEIYLPVHPSGSRSIYFRARQQIRRSQSWQSLFQLQGWVEGFQIPSLCLSVGNLGSLPVPEKPPSQILFIEN